MKNCIVCLKGKRIINMDKIIEKFRDNEQYLNFFDKELSYEELYNLFKT